MRLKEHCVFEILFEHFESCDSLEVHSTKPKAKEQFGLLDDCLVDSKNTVSLPTKGKTYTVFETLQKTHLKEVLLCRQFFATHSAPRSTGRVLNLLFGFVECLVEKKLVKSNQIVKYKSQIHNVPLKVAS